MAAKKIISLFLALALALTMLAGAALAEGGADEHTIEFVDYDLFIQNQNANTLLDMLTLDSMYGLKDVHDIHSFAQLFYEIGFDEPLSGASAEDADLSIYALINSYLDDIHSEWGAYSYLTGQSDTKFHVGPSETRWGRHVDDYEKARAQAYPDGWLAYEEVGNTAYITFDSFKALANNSEEYYDPELVAENPVWDTITLILYAHRQINREGSPIENVVIDLSNNSGGAVDAAVVVIAWYLGEASLSIKDTFTGAMSNSIYRADVNLDRVFDDADTVADKNLFCLISPVSFSCGNLVPCAFKESGKVTLLGRTSGGGSCMVLSASSAWGTSFKLSSPYRTSFLKNGTFYDIDRGAEPDYPINAPAKFFDRVALTDYINSLY